jgi:glycosyltransferase involved in cell wall biosynthesis
VIALDTSSLKEVIGDSGILVEAGNEQALGNEILNVIKDRQLREKLKEKSLIQASKFNWEDTAQKTIELYNKII